MIFFLIASLSSIALLVLGILGCCNVLPILGLAFNILFIIFGTIELSLSLLYLKNWLGKHKDKKTQYAKSN